MATPITGAISLGDVRTELGASGAISFDDSLFRQLTNQLSGAATLENARASASVNASTNNLNAYTGLFSSTGTVANFKILVRSGVNVNATAGNTALVLGQFPTGSTIVINNYGSILAAGGAGGSNGATGSSGGDAIFANYANQTVTINNQSGAVIYGGGGGGGSGGSGGTGGTGGGGQFSSIQYRYDGSNVWQVANFNSSIYGVWDGVNVFYVLGQSGATFYNGYYRGSFQGTDPDWYLYQIGVSVTTNTNGGAGGSGGSRGAGGRGQGADGANASGSAGGAGAAGSAGGTNAGAGGQGGTGGTGGAGGTYGNAGSTGSTGNTGATGANGNRTNGSAGSAGTGGAAGGAAGRYLVKGSNSVTLNNSGTVLGGLA